MPTVQRDAPLGTYLGWNITAGPADVGYDERPFHAGQVCNYVGGMVPFFKTKAQRLAAGDPRLSLEERYNTHAGYVAAVTAAANQLAQDLSSGSTRGSVCRSAGLSGIPKRVMKAGETIGA